jgi:cytochrome b561
LNARGQRYTAIAIVLHWAIAVAVAGMIPLGWWMGEALESPNTQAQAIAAFQLHKSLGLTILALSLVRLAWRFMNPAPPLPAAMKPWERLLAAGVHWAFYAIIIVLPLSGWLYVSTAWSIHDQRSLDVPTLYFGLFHVPHLFGLAGLDPSARAAFAGIFEFIHSKLAWGVIGLAALHAAAALKHQLVDQDGVLARMVPGLPTRDEAPPATPGRAFVLACGFAAIAFAAAGAVWLFENPPTGAGAAPASVVHSHGDDHEHAAGEAADTDEHVPAVTPHAANEQSVPTWQVVSGASSIVFTGIQAGVPFEGRFGAWRADIRFDPNNLDQSSAVVIIDTGSASDGVPLHDQSLPGTEWFDVANHPTATFRTTSIHAHGAGAYEAHARLTIKGRPIDLTLPFTVQVDGDRAVMNGTATISRLDADLGMASDPNAEFVSLDIGVRVHVEATRAR